MERPSVKEMEKALGFDKIKPIRLSPAMEKELEEDADYFRKWYEEELWERYKEIIDEQK